MRNTNQKRRWEWDIASCIACLYREGSSGGVKKQTIWKEATYYTSMGCNHTNYNAIINFVSINFSSKYISKKIFEK